jgi:hypothetical protein
MLSKSRILELAGVAPDRRVCAKTCTEAHSKSGCKCYPHISEAAALDLAVKVEREVLLQQAVLVGNLSKALKSCRVNLEGTRFKQMEYDRDLVDKGKAAAEEFFAFILESDHGSSSST